MSQQQASELLLTSICEELTTTSIEHLPCIEERNAVVSKITEDFYECFEEFPSSIILQKLADYLMLDHIKSPHHIRNEEGTTFHTKSQALHRRRKEALVDTDVASHFNANNTWNFPQKRRTMEKEVN